MPVIVGEILDGRRVQSVGEQYDALRESAHIYARAAFARRGFGRIEAFRSLDARFRVLQFGYFPVRIFRGFFQHADDLALRGRGRARIVLRKRKGVLRHRSFRGGSAQHHSRNGQGLDGLHRYETFGLIQEAEHFRTGRVIARSDG